MRRPLDIEARINGPRLVLNLLGKCKLPIKNVTYHKLLVFYGTVLVQLTFNISKVPIISIVFCYYFFIKFVIVIILRNPI